MTETTTRSSLISGPKIQLATSLPLYGRDIPQALHDLFQLLPDAPTTEDNQRHEEPSTPPTEEPTSQVENSETQDPAQVQVDHHQPAAPSNDPPVVITPSGYTQTRHQICLPARFAYVAYHCKNLAQTGIWSVFDFHPFASL